jgi:hypothetical protein
MPLDKQNFNYSIPLSAPLLSADNGVIVGDNASSALISNGKILYSLNGTTYIPVGISTVVANSVSYSPTAPTNPSVGQMWVDSTSNNTNYDPNLIRRKTIVATGGQTAFTADLAFTDGYEQVFLNGLLLTRNTDYTTVNSIQVNLVVAAVVNDVIDILSITNLNSVGAAGALTTSNTFTGSQTFTPSSAAITPITINGAFNQTADLLQIKKYDGTYGLNISNTGNIGIGGQAASALSPKVYIYNDTTGGVFQTVGNDTWFGWEMDSFQPNGKYAGIVIAAGRGTSSSPLPVQTGDRLGFLRFNGYGSSTQQNVSAEIAVYATENHTTSTGASAMVFYTSPTGQNYYAERMRIDSTGNVGIGTSTPSQKLEVAATSSIASSTWSGGTDFIKLNAISSSYSEQSISFQEAGANIGAKIGVKNTANGAYDIIFANRDTSSLTSTLTERMRISNVGYLLVGYTSSNGAYKLQVNSQIFATSSAIATSDAKFKKNVKEITGGLDMIDSLRPVQFDWKKHKTHNFVEGKTVGFIAQEVREALKDQDWVGNLVKSNYNEETEEEFLGLAESNIIPLLVSAVKELRAEVKELRGMIK